MAKSSAFNLEFIREDDFVEYFIFPEIPENLLIHNPPSDILEQLRQHLTEVLVKCMEAANCQIKERNYIWHKDEFQLQVRTGSALEYLLNEELYDNEETLPPHLHGVTHYGDNIDDEWFIVHLLYTITREVSGCIARIIDSDGEFLLIEAADALPKWANPDTCERRVYLANGLLQLVQNSPSNTIKPISVHSAISKIRLNPTLYNASKEIEKYISNRLKVFEDTRYALHRQIVHLPLGVAVLLKQRADLIAPAVRAFCDRDAIDMKACRTMRFFPPEQRVRTNICFTRCLYAMIMHSNYVPDRRIGWNLSNSMNTEQYKEDLLGVKIACGFEILASQAKDIDTEENDPKWLSYVRNLNSKGYFRGNVEGSEEYNKLLTEAKNYFKNNKERFRTAQLVGRDILELLKCIDTNLESLRDEENNLQPSDSDEWLNVSAEDLDAILMERYGAKKLYTTNGDINAEEFTKNIAEFLEKQSAFEGIEIHSDAEDDTINNDFKSKVKKNLSMRKACKQNSVLETSSDNTQDATNPNEDKSYSTQIRNFLDFVIPEDNWDSNSDMSDYEDEDDLERNIEAMTNSEKNIDLDIKAYMAQMDRELANTTVGQSFSGLKATPSTSTAHVDDEFDDIESFKPININVNTLKNMMDGYKSQLGGSGPVSNLLNAMGIGMSTATKEDELKDLSESTV